MPPDELTTETAPGPGWLHLEAPGQSAHVYVQEGDEVTVAYEADGGEE